MPHQHRCEPRSSGTTLGLGVCCVLGVNFVLSRFQLKLYGRLVGIADPQEKVSSGQLGRVSSQTWKGSWVFQPVTVDKGHSPLLAALSPPVALVLHKLRSIIVLHMAHTSVLACLTMRDRSWWPKREEAPPCGNSGSSGPENKQLRFWWGREEEGIKSSNVTPAQCLRL